MGPDSRALPPKRWLLAYGRDLDDATVTSSMRLSNAVALAVLGLTALRIVLDVGLRGGTVVLRVHVPLILLIVLALWLARIEWRLASRLVVLLAVAGAVTASSHLLGRGGGSHYYCPALAAYAWLVLPPRLWPVTLAVNVYAALLFANAELLLPELGIAADPQLLRYTRRISLVMSFVVLAGASWTWMTTTRRAQRELERIARTDGLTGIFNRRWFVALGSLELARASRHRRPLSLALFDIDHFKHVNDTYGHHAGDRVIQIVVAAIAAELRVTDVLARVGGEELALLLPETDVAGARTCVDRVLRRIEETSVELDGHVIRVTTSAGVTSANVADTTIESLLRRADAGLYESKRGGRNRVTVVASLSPRSASSSIARDPAA